MFEKALLYFDAKELPTSWDKDELFGDDSDDDDDQEEVLCPLVYHTFVVGRTLLSYNTLASCVDFSVPSVHCRGQN